MKDLSTISLHLFVISFHDTSMKLSLSHYHNGILCIMENTVTSDLLLHDKPLIRKIIGWK